MPLWNPLLPDGRYRNPLIFADYSDPDVVRVGTDYYLTASSFQCTPGLPILHSRDMVHWRLIGHALPRQVPEDVFAHPQQGKGVWAPSIRHHGGLFQIFYPDPDFGIYRITATDPAGPWSRPQLIRGGSGLIDPCPFWDDDGRTWMVHGWARSRAGIANILSLVELSPDGSSTIDKGQFVVDGNKIPGFTTLEGPKLYKREGWYYIFAPAGGVTQGWQTVFRSRSVAGPYETRIVLAQGKTSTNGPHQGAWVDTPDGASWFYHFQDRGAYGRILHLQPMTWKDGWPQMGEAIDAKGCGQPVSAHACPLPLVSDDIPATSDEFESPVQGLQWQWQANPKPTWSSLTARPGWLRLISSPQEDGGGPPTANLYGCGRMLLQKLPAPVFEVTTRLDFSAAEPGDTAGLTIFGMDYAWVGLVLTDHGLRWVQSTCIKAVDGAPEVVWYSAAAHATDVLLRVSVTEGAVCQFSFATTGKDGTGGVFTPAGGPFKAREGRWVGAKVGVFAQNRSGHAGHPIGHADFDWFRVG